MIVALNHKSNFTKDEILKYLEDYKNLNTYNHEMILIPSVCYLPLIPDNITYASEDVSSKAMGAYTGETSVDMLAAVGVKYCIVGHSERRQYFAETNEIVNKKAKKLLEKDISPIVCVGETLEERENSKMFDVVKEQVEKSLDGIDKDMIAKKVVIAYEPIWAIGTGKTASAQQANEMCKYIRKVVSDMYDEKTAELVRIQYGGSVKPNNAKEILNMSDIDGALVGGASLTNDFVAIVNYD